MRYGLYDTVDGVWLGDDAGPRTWGEGDVVNGHALTDLSAQILARCAAEAACYTVDWDATRVRVLPIDEGPKQLRDEIPKTRTERDWLTRKERGSIP